MPAIKSINCNNNILTVFDQDGSYEFDAGDIPNNADSIQTLEDYLNNEWFPSLATDAQIKVHIFSVSPLFLTAWTANIGEECPINWWVE